MGKVQVAGQPEGGTRSKLRPEKLSFPRTVMFNVVER